MKLSIQNSSARLVLLLITLLVISTTRSITARESANLLTGLECRHFTDSMEIPHLRAVDEKTAFACLGYVHGLERPWQMDFLRRSAQGRAAEILGAQKLKTDYLLRILGLYSRAERLASEMDPVLRERFEFYAAGVNRGMSEAMERLAGSDRRGVYEFADFEYRPDPWKPQDSVAILLLMSFDQTRRTFEDKVVELERTKAFGTRARDLFGEDGLPWDTAILKAGEYRQGRLPVAPVAPSASVKIDALSALHELGFSGALEPGTETGSNNWVISPTRSRSGHAWLANDPHLSITRPGFWQWVHLSSDDGVDVIGATVPGMPFFASGANRNVAWGLTNSYFDVTDAAFISEKDLGDAKTERPWVWFRWWKFKLPFFFKTISRTVDGEPILPIPSPDGTRLVLRWSGFGLGPGDLHAFVDLMKARSARDFDAGLRKTGIPSFNYVFADRTGNIGYRTIGLAPHRTPDTPYAVPVLASRKDFASWTFRTADEMPAAFNPKRGYVATANNRQWPADAAEGSGRFYRRGLRAFRIEEKLTAEPKHGLESLKALQCDTQAVEARWVLPALLKALPRQGLSGEETRALEALHDWASHGFVMNSECRACGIYRIWLDHVLEGRKPLETAPLYRLLAEKNKGPSELMPTDRDVSEAFNAAVREAGSKTWADLHRAPYSHLAGPTYRVVDSVATPGDTFSVNVGESKWNGERFDHTVGPSMRMIVEMSDTPKIALALPGSNRDPENPRIGDARGPYERWARCEYSPAEFPVDWSKAVSEILRF